MEVSHIPILGGEVPDLNREPLPDIQHLRGHLKEIVANHDDAVARAYLLLAELEKLKSQFDVGSSHIHSRLFFNSVEAFAHTKLADHHRVQILSSSPEDTSLHRMPRFRHLLGRITARRNMQADMAEMIMQPDAPPGKKLYTRMRGIISSANFLYPDEESGLTRLGLRSIVTEHAILDGLREVWPSSHYSSPIEDARLGVDEYAAPKRGPELPLQVKYAASRWGEIQEMASKSVTTVVASPDFKREPFRFSSPTIKTLARIVLRAREKRARQKNQRV